MGKIDIQWRNDMIKNLSSDIARNLFELIMEFYASLVGRSLRDRRESLVP
jgi:hypothetical protein